MKHLAFLALILIGQMTHAQVVEKGDFLIDIGMEGGYYSTDIELTGTDVDTAYSDTAATFFIPLHLEYMISNRVSVGLLLKSGQYLSDDEQENKTRVYMINAAYHPFAKEKFDPFVRLGFGGSSISINETEINSDGETVKTEAKFSGSAFELELGFKLYFSERIGMNLGLGYNSYKHNLDSFTSDNIDEDLTDVEWKLDASGIELGIGLAIKL